jgi:hypothetical protein
MILLPYFIDTSNESWTKLNLFVTEGGRSFWQTDEKDSDVKKMLEENGFPILKTFTENGVVYAEVDQNKIQINDFYRWDEVNPDTSMEDVWRTYLIPASLRSCPIFQNEFWKSTGLSPMVMRSSIFSSI